MKYQFKTNIMCSSCIAKVRPHLDANNNINKWEVDTGNPDKVLTVETDNLTGDELKNIVINAGYTAEPINSNHHCDVPQK